MLSSIAEQRKWSYVHALSKHTQKNEETSFVIQFDLQPIIEYNVRKILEKEKKVAASNLSKKTRRCKVTEVKEYDAKSLI